MNIVIVTPMLREFHCAREAFGASEEPGKPYRYAGLSRKGKSIRIVQCGRDLKGCLDFEIALSGLPGLLVDSGTAGGLSDKVQIGDLCRGELFLYNHHPDIGLAEYADLGEHVSSASVLTVDKAVVSSAHKAEYQNLADICTMESYHLAFMAKELGCSFLSLRVVTDMADEYTPVSFKKNSRKLCMNLYSSLKEILQNISH